MTFDELVSIWHGSAEWWLKAEGSDKYFYKDFITNMTVPTYLKIRDCEILNIDDWDVCDVPEEQVLMLTLKIPHNLDYWVNLCISLNQKEKEVREQGDEKSE